MLVVRGWLDDHMATGDMGAEALELPGQLANASLQSGGGLHVAEGDLQRKFHGILRRLRIRGQARKSRTAAGSANVPMSPQQTRADRCRTPGEIRVIDRVAILVERGSTLATGHACHAQVDGLIIEYRLADCDLLGSEGEGCPAPPPCAMSHASCRADAFKAYFSLFPSADGDALWPCPMPMPPPMPIIGQVWLPRSRQPCIICVRHSARLFSERRHAAICSCREAIFSRISLEGAACAAAVPGASADQAEPIGRSARAMTAAFRRTSRRAVCLFFIVHLVSGASLAGHSLCRPPDAIRSFHHSNASALGSAPQRQSAPVATTAALAEPGVSMEASIDHRELRGPKEKCCCGWPAAMAEYWGSAFVSIRPNGRSATGTQLPACSAAERG